LLGPCAKAPTNEKRAIANNDLRKEIFIFLYLYVFMGCRCLIYTYIARKKVGALETSAPPDD